MLTTVGQAFEHTLTRWRELYRAALHQAQAQDRIIRDATRSPADKRQAERLRAEAEAQLKLLTEVENIAQADFYSYRYFASEGFLPGYNFPRLPISAYIPGRRTKQRDEFLSRPRFLAIAEFGPRSIIYHEGSRYIVNKVILPVNESDGSGEVQGERAKLCAQCGYLHPMMAAGADLCERCGTLLSAPLQPLFRMQNVTARRRDNINADEEERVRLGYELKTALRFPAHDGQPTARTATVDVAGETVLRLTYGQAATLWRINLGWARRQERNQWGFVLDTERGYWARDTTIADDPDDPLSVRTTRVIPYVDDRRNCLLIEPTTRYDLPVMASLQAALKHALQIHFQLEENELAAEPLPDDQTRRLLLFYEAAEGGAGVLRRLLDDPQALASLASTALELCHFDPQTGADLRRAPRAREDCEAACYDCLMSYANQREHALLDRQSVRTLLLHLAQGHTTASPTLATRATHLEHLLRQAGSELERRWLRWLDTQGYRLPDRAQLFIESCQTRPDFFYADHHTAIYIDGPPHDSADRQVRDQQQTEAMEDAGYTVIRCGHLDDWAQIATRYPYIFGMGSGEGREA